MRGTGGLDRAAGRARRPGGSQPARDVLGRRNHAIGVLDYLAHFAEDTAQALFQLASPYRVGDGVDLDVHPRLDDRPGWRLGRIHPSQDVLQPAGEIAADDHDRMHDVAHVSPASGQVGGDRVHQVGHVVRDDVHHRGRARPAVAGPGRVEHLDGGGPGHPVCREPAVGSHRADEVGGVAFGDSFRRDIAEVPAQKLSELGSDARCSLNRFSHLALDWFETGGMVGVPARGSVHGRTAPRGVSAATAGWVTACLVTASQVTSREHDTSTSSQEIPLV